MIYNKFLEYLNYNELIDGKYIKMLVENYITLNKLENFYEKTTIDFHSPYMAAYLKDKKEIIINTDAFVKKALNIKGDYNIFEMNPKTIYQLNLLFLSTIYHELNHVSQMNEKNDLVRDIYDNCFYIMKKNINSYYKYHKYFITEWNANIKAELYLDKFLDELTLIDSNTENQRINQRINVWYDSLYNESDGEIISPLEYYKYYTNQSFNGHEIINDPNYSKLNTQEKIIYGLPIDEKIILDKSKIKTITKDLLG